MQRRPALVLASLISVPVVIVTFFMACGGKSNSSDTRGEGTETTTSDQASIPGTGSLAIEVAPQEAADATTAAGAAVTVLDHPDITGTTNDQGVAELVNVPPGTLAIIVTSSDGAALTAGGASYGLKIDDIEVKANAKTDLGKQTLKKTGSLSGNVKFYSNPNHLDLTGSDVFIPGTSFMAKTDDAGAFVLSGVPEGTYKFRAQHTGFAVLDIAEVTVTEDSDTPLGSILLSLSTGPEGSIAIDPDATVTISGKSKSVMTATSREVEVKLTYDGDTALMMVSDEPSFLNKDWMPVAATYTWKKFTTDGAKSIYVKYSDLNGLESSPYSVDFIVDSEAPTDGSIALENGWDQLSNAATSMRATVSAADAGTGVAKMMICTTNAFETCGSWVDYSTEAAGIAVSANVYVKFKDHVGHVSAVATDSINLGSHTIIAGGTYSNNLKLYKAQSPYRYDSDVIVNGDMSIEPGVTLDHGGSSSKTIKVLGQLSANGTSGEPITLTASSSSFGGFNLSDSTADDNIFRYLSVGSGVIGTNPLIKINGGTVANNNITGGGQTIFVEKSGYKSAVIEDNQIASASVSIAGGNASTVRRNAFTGGVCPSINISGGSETQISYNSISVSCNAASTPVKAIVITAGNASVTYNDVAFTCSDTGVANGILLSGGGTVTATHNNFDVQSSTTTNVIHLHDTGSDFVADYNYYTGHATTNPNHSGTITSDAHIQGSAWPTTFGSTGCVGASCD